MTIISGTAMTVTLALILCLFLALILCCIWFACSIQSGAVPVGLVEPHGRGGATQGLRRLLTEPRPGLAGRLVSQ